MTHRTINPDDARTALKDALSDVLHVLEAESEEPRDGGPIPEGVAEELIANEVANELPGAYGTHYLAERDGGDDLGSIEVVL